MLLRSAARFSSSCRAQDLLCSLIAVAEEARDVELALNLNVLAVFAAFALIAAILLGAF
jgi:hypothetical protein